MTPIVLTMRLPVSAGCSIFVGVAFVGGGGGSGSGGENALAAVVVVIFMIDVVGGDVIGVSTAALASPLLIAVLASAPSLFSLLIWERGRRRRSRARSRSRRVMMMMMMMRLTVAIVGMRVWKGGERRRGCG